MRSRSWICSWYLWFMISGITFVALLWIFYILSIPRLKCVDQNRTVCSRRGRTKDLYNEMICSLFLYLKLRAINPCTLFAVAAFLCLFLSLELFGDDFWIPLLICCRQLLIGHVIVALYLSCPMYGTDHLSTLKFICHLFTQSTSLFISSCSSVMLSGFLALLQSLISANLDILLTTLGFEVIYIYIRNSSGPNT